jgi:hypothetical protein
MPGLLDTLLGTPNKRACDCIELLVYPNSKHALCQKHNRLFKLVPIPEERD